MDPGFDTGSVRWSVRPYSWEAAARLAEALQVPFPAAMVLAARGLTEPDEARRFLECSPEIPDPFLFDHMEAAVGVIADAIKKRTRVIVHGDYDADGITATAALVQGLRAFGLEPECYLPSRFKEGYGLSRAAVDHISAEGPGLLLTVDCGVNYPEEVALAKERGLEVVVIDHHHPGPRLPDCLLIHEAVGRYPQGRLCGVGLALKVLHALHVALRGAATDHLPEGLAPLLDLVAIGTIADLAPLTGENRFYVSEGLKCIGIGTRVGLRALAQVSGCTGTVDSTTVAFRLAPRLNAAGRLADPWPPLRLLLTQNEEEARRLALRLHELNGARQDVERQILDAAVRLVERESPPPPILVLAGEDWHEGVVGIVASRLVERYHRPAILLGVQDGVAKGSGRSIGQYDLVRALNACSEHLTVYGGHPQAVGLTLPAEHVDEFRAAMVRHAGTLLKETDFVPWFKADAVLRGEDLALDTATALSCLGPFGLGNPRPRVVLVGAGVRDPEATRDGSHLRLSVEVDGVRTRGIGFGLGELADGLRSCAKRHLVGAQFQVEPWQGNLRTQLLVERLEELPALGLTAAAEPDWEVWSRMDHCEAPLSANLGVCPPKYPLPIARDLRDRGGGLSAVAQVLATGERTLVVAGSVAWWFAGLEPALCFSSAVGRQVMVLGSTAVREVWRQAQTADTVFTEWDVLARTPGLLDEREHLIVAGPPFRVAHLAGLRDLTSRPSLHLYYGARERQLTQRLVRCLVHPRFSMVCMYRVLQEDPTEECESSPSGPDPRTRLLVHAARRGWEEQRVVLSKSGLRQAWDILTEAGVERLTAVKGKLEVRTFAAYRCAETHYEECLRLCRSI